MTEVVYDGGDFNMESHRVGYMRWIRKEIQFSVYFYYQLAMGPFGMSTNISEVQFLYLSSK